MLLDAGGRSPATTDRGISAEYRSACAIRILASMPGRVLLGQRPRILEAFRPMFDAAPYTMFANVTGQPSISLPLHWSAEGLPMGLLSRPGPLTRPRFSGYPPARAVHARGPNGGRRWRRLEKRPLQSRIPLRPVP